MWWTLSRQAIVQAISGMKKAAADIGAIGISYQMHGLVCLDKQGNALGNSIIWCDSRAVETGNQLALQLGADYCREHLLNLPGNFTTSKLKWVMDHEPARYEKTDRIMLPGDYIAYRLTGEINTTIGGLSEGIFWDFREERISEKLLRVSGISNDLLPDIVPAFGEQGRLMPAVAAELGLKPGIPVSYRAGDQPNNAFSLNVLHPGEVAATAGTSGVVYGVAGRPVSDPLSRINTFAHVNHTPKMPRYGALLCINGTGILNAWLRKNVANGADYARMNEEASAIPAGSEGLMILPFGNGAERMLQNLDTGCRISRLNFNRHSRAHLFRAALEGLAFAFRYGTEVMQETGLNLSTIRAGNANMFLSPVFRQTLSDVCQVTIDLYNADGATGAALGAAVGAGFCDGISESAGKIKNVIVVRPSGQGEFIETCYQRWKNELNNLLSEMEINDKN
jgi:xylulokinase